VLKEVGGSDLVSGIRKVAAGNSLLEPGLGGRVIEREAAVYAVRRREKKD
jgi:hypothetical protein